MFVSHCQGSAEALETTRRRMIAGGTALVASTFALPGRAHELKPFIASIAAPPLVLQRLDGPGFDLASLGR
jgi:hypothetical protein